ncbi:MAG TPA: AsmA-like C-terminal region-containing protein [Acidobacteriaceae bacterium]
MATAVRSSRTHRIHRRELIIAIAIAVVMVTVHLLFFFWPFRYREVHPLLEHTFRSKVDVRHYHRIYLPHPGFVAEDVTFYRHGDTHIPPLATMSRMTVSGTWLGLIFHPHELREIRLEELHVQIPPPGTRARGMDFDQGVVSTSQSKMVIDTILADHTTLDFLRHDQPPLRFVFGQLQVNRIQQGQPFTFSAKIATPEPEGLVIADGSIGPIRTNHYAATPVSGNYTLAHSDLRGIDGITGHAKATGHYSGTFSAVHVAGTALIPDFRAGNAHKVALDASYQVIVNGQHGDVQILNTQIRTGKSVITVAGSVAGNPKSVSLQFGTEGSRLQQLLDLVEQSEPTIDGNVRFNAAANFTSGSGSFLQRLNLTGDITLDQVYFVTDKQRTVDAFSARVRQNPPGAANETSTPPLVYASASSHTRFKDGIASLPDIRVDLPGAQAKLHGTFNLLNTDIRLIGTAALQKSLSHAATGWKAVLLKPLSPFFKKKDAGAVVAIAVTGTAQKPNLTQNILHTK